jgi:hypothetical protein
MSNVLKINDKVSFNKFFLSPVSRISDSAVLVADSSKLKCLSCTSDNSIIFYVEYEVESDIEDEMNLNCSDIKKLIKALDNINSRDITFQVDRNNIAYKDSNIRFKYHLLEDDIIKVPKINLSKLDDMEIYSNFSLGEDKVKELIKASVFSSDSNKLYLSSNEDGVHAELTDKTRNNIDTITIKISDSYDGESIKELPLNFEIFRIMGSSSFDEIKVKINNKIGLVIFELEGNYNKMKYIMSSLIK